MSFDFLEHSLNKSHEDLSGLSIKTQSKNQYQVDSVLFNALMSHTNDKATLQKCFNFFLGWAFIRIKYSSCAFFIENRCEMMLSGNIFIGIFRFHSFFLFCYVYVAISLLWGIKWFFFSFWFIRLCINKGISKCLSSGASWISFE